MEWLKKNLHNNWLMLLFGIFLLLAENFKQLIIFVIVFSGGLFVVTSIMKSEQTKSNAESKRIDTQDNLPDDKNVIEFYLNNQKNIRYHGERMWDSMKIFGVVFPAITGILTFLINSQINSTSQPLFGKEVSFLFIIPIVFTGIFWFNCYREYIRFLEFALMSWKAEKKLGFHKSIETLNNETLVFKRFLEKPELKHKFGKSFWTTICLFFGSSIIMQLGLMAYIYNIIP